MPNLELLSLACITDPLTERTARLISSRKKLKYLLIENAVLSQDAIRVLLGIPVEVLSIETVPVADHLQFLNTEKLLNLTLNHCGLKNSNATALGSAPKLQYLDVQGNEYINTDFILRLGSLKKLKIFYLNEALLTMDDCRQIIKKFPSLQCLSAETSYEGEAVLKSNLVDFALLPHHAGGNRMWHTEYDEPLETKPSDPKRDPTDVSAKR